MAYKLGSSETSLEKWLDGFVRKIGGATLKLTFTAGIPDRLVLLPGGKIIFLELKTEIGRIGPMQVWWLSRLRKLGFTAECARTKQEILELLK